MSSAEDPIAFAFCPRSPKVLAQRRTPLRSRLEQMWFREKFIVFMAVSSSAFL
jgi:hypothetical protein